MSEATPSQIITRLSAPPTGDFVTVGAHRFFVCQEGSGGPTTVILPGAGTVGLDYFGVFAAAASLGSTLLYDRLGTGWSDSVPLPRTPTEVVDELRSLLRAAGVQPPYLLLGHSLGGGYAQLFARRFPEEVAALLLLDPAHEDYPKYEPPSASPEPEQAFDMTSWEPPPQVLERFAELFTEKFAAYPSDVRDAVIAYHRTHWRAGILEASNLKAIYADLGRPAPLGDIPTVVLTALSLDPGTQLFMPDEWQRLVIEGKRKLNAAIAASVPRGENRELPEACHSFMMAERPDAVAQALRDLLAIVRTDAAARA